MPILLTIFLIWGGVKVTNHFRLHNYTCDLGPQNIDNVNDVILILDFKHVTKKQAEAQTNEVQQRLYNKHLLSKIYRVYCEETKPRNY